MRRIIFISIFTLILSGCNLVQQRSDVTQKYINGTYGFELEYPKGMVFVTPTYPELQDKVVQLQTKRGVYPNTNFGDAAFSVSAAYAKDMAECLKLPEVESVGNFATKVNINGNEFYLATSTGAAAGNFYESRIYRALISGQLCMELNETLHTTNIGNYEPGTVTEVNKEPVWAELETITRSFRITE